jgi:predicted ABC-type ATPase
MSQRFIKLTLYIIALLSLLDASIVTGEPEISFNKFHAFYTKSKSSFHDHKALEYLYKTYLANCSLQAKKQSVFITLAGIPGSGKSTLAKKFKQFYPNFLLHEIDEFSLNLAIYYNDLAKMDITKATNKWFPIAVEISTVMLKYAIVNNISIIYNRTCTKKECEKIMHYAKHRDYKIILAGVQVSPDIAYERVQTRVINKTGNYTPMEYIQKCNLILEKKWPKLITIANYWILFDNNSSIQPYRIIAKNSLFLKTRS